MTVFTTKALCNNTEIKMITPLPEKNDPLLCNNLFKFYALPIITYFSSESIKKTTYSKCKVRSVERIACFNSCIMLLYSFEHRFAKILWPCERKKYITIGTYKKAGKEWVAGAKVSGYSQCIGKVIAHCQMKPPLSMLISNVYRLSLFSGKRNQ